jgi:hypothetical protein
MPGDEPLDYEAAQDGAKEREEYLKSVAEGRAIYEMCRGH